MYKTSVDTRCRSVFTCAQTSVNCMDIYIYAYTEYCFCISMGFEELEMNRTRNETGLRGARQMDLLVALRTSWGKGEAPPACCRALVGSSPPQRDELQMRRIRDEANYKWVLCMCICSDNMRWYGFWIVLCCRTRETRWAYDGGKHTGNVDPIRAWKNTPCWGTQKRLWPAILLEGVLFVCHVTQPLIGFNITSYYYIGFPIFSGLL